MTTTYWQRNWRIVTVAVLGATLAFLGSFLIEPTFVSQTRILIHGRDATFLSSTGQDLTTQPGVIDSQLSNSLAATYAGMATSRGVATAVVEELDLDSPKRSDGLVRALASGFAWVYRCSRAFVTAGYCADVNPYEKAIAEVQEGTSVEPLGANAGSTAGMGGSYVLQVESSGHSPQEAQEITDAMADELIAVSQRRYTEDAARSLKALEEQLVAANAEVSDRSKALANYQTEHGIAAADGKLALSAGTYEALRADLLTARAEEADLRAQLVSIDQSLATVPRSQSSSQTIVTGRSTTELNSSNASAVYTELLTQQRTTQAKLDGHVARVAQLEASVNGSAPISSNATLAGMTDLETQLQLAQEGQADLTAAVQRARTTKAQGPVGLTRLDTAWRPDYPTEPKRYIYLALGLMLGAVAGGGLTVWANRREVGPLAPAVTANDPELLAEIDPTRPVTQWPEPETAEVLSGAPHGNGHRDVSSPAPTGRPTGEERT